MRSDKFDYRYVKGGTSKVPLFYSSIPTFPSIIRESLRHDAFADFLAV